MSCVISSRAAATGNEAGANEAGGAGRVAIKARLFVQLVELVMDLPRRSQFRMEAAVCAVPRR